ncbi:MAG: MFS transporter [Rhizobiales bacterium]|nr:MFS transporter [Hyphomicrobiales bacterium]OJY06250.1 MAG: hypothetical protein BGP07_01310 [Rhizobiales bacterium 63-22]
MPEASNQQYHTLREDSMREMNVTTIIDDGAVSGRQKLLFLFCGLTMLVDGFDAQAMGYAAPAVIRDLGLTKGQLAPIFSIGLLGIAVGNFLLGSLSDKYGRKTVLLWSLVSFGLLTIAKAYATTESHFLVLQFLAGLGIGAAYPNALSLAGEYAPERIRSMTVTSCGMGYLVGTFLGGLIAAFVIPRWGWQSVFIIGGVAALLVAAGAAFGVVESVKQLAAVRAPADTIRRTLAKLGVTGLPSDVVFTAPEVPTQGSRLGALFGDGRGVYTALIWTTTFMLLLQTYFILSWLPTIFADAGLPVSQSVLAVAPWSIGSLVSSLVLAKYLHKSWGMLLLGVVCAVYAVGTVAIGYSTGSFLLLAVIVFIVGIGSGPQGVTHALNIAIYPTRIRSTGVGWASGVGRFGSIVGPLVGGYLLTNGWGMQDILAAAAVPGVIAAVAITLIGILEQPRRLLTQALNHKHAPSEGEPGH